MNTSTKFLLTVGLVGLIAATSVSSIQENQSTSTTTNSTSSSSSKKLFAYSGSLLPSDWSLVSILNDRAIIGFNNGSARNAALSELDLKDRVLLQKLQNGTLYATPLQGAKEKLAQWSSSFTSTAGKLGKSLKEQFDSLINKNKDSASNSTLTTTTIVN